MMEPEYKYQNRVLVVDDEKNIRRVLRMVLEGIVSSVEDCSSAEEALSLMHKNPAHVVLLDIKLPGMDGIELLSKVRRLWGKCEVIMISGHATIQDAIEATRLGAYDVLEKPLDRDRVVLSVKNCLEKIALHKQVEDLHTKLNDQYQMIGTSPVMYQLFEKVKKVAPTNGRVLITGESGSGKELVARAIHRLSKRSNGPFVKVNCAAIPSELIESELFGYERGAFTGAISKKKGQFELASKGTLFLDEVGDMSLAAQAKVLRVLQTGELTHVGAERTICVDVRILAASNKNLKKSIQLGNFREDLYFRLNVIPIHCPPLRDRIEDIPVLTIHFIKEFSAENDFKRKEIAPGVFTQLKRYCWPGNVRELKNVIERMVIMSGDMITVHDVPDYILSEKRDVNVQRFGGMSLKNIRKHVERSYIRAALDECSWNITRTAEKLGIERTNLHKKIKQLDVRRD